MSSIDCITGISLINFHRRLSWRLVIRWQKPNKDLPRKQKNRFPTFCAASDCRPACVVAAIGAYFAIPIRFILRFFRRNRLTFSKQFNWIFISGIVIGGAIVFDLWLMLRAIDNDGVRALSQLERAANPLENRDVENIKINSFWN